ncbi:exodeoxyribonuclease VII large subunit [bacterium]|nr:exodeoxyribonuclease VII large subunit [bacterium]
METLTLKNFLEAVKNSLDTSFPLQYWVSAEIADLKVHTYSQHCYLDLVEKNQHSVIAKTGGVIWKNRFEYISRKFTEATGQPLKDGMKVLLLIEVLFHGVYGFKLNVNDIDPSYTLGEFALHKKKILALLEKEGLLNKNKLLPFPTVPQRIAVISSPTAAGYEDFMNTLNNNPYKYLFKTELFHAYMQGELSEKSITEALGSPSIKEGKFDIAIIIRGGGDKVDLHSFDNHNIGKAIALCPIPVITGIGHQRDETVADIVAHTKLISPTAVAEFIILKTREFEENLEQAGRRFSIQLNNQLAKQQETLSTIDKHLLIFTNFFIQQKKQSFNALIENFKNSTSKQLAANEFKLKQLPEIVLKGITVFFKSKKISIERYKDKIDLMNPVNVLKKGYTLTFKNGSLVKNFEELQTGDSIKTKFHTGEVESRVTKVKKTR